MEKTKTKKKNEIQLMYITDIQHITSIHTTYKHVH